MTAGQRYFSALAALAVSLFAALGSGWVPEAWVERVHVAYVLPFLRVALGGISAAIPFSLAECLLALLAVLSVGALVELGALLLARRGGRLRLSKSAAVLGLVLAWLYLLGHGISLARPPMAERLGLDAIEVADRAGSYRELALASARAARAERASWRARGGRVPSYERVGRLAREALLAALPALEPTRAVTLPPGSIKSCTPAGFLMRFGVSGVFSPWTFEAHVDRALPATTLPFVAAHELAHLAGIAGEDEANFAAWLACTRSPDPFVRYSGHLVALNYFRGRALRAEIREAHGPEVQADRVANAAAWKRRRSRRLSAIQTKVWDTALKGQGIRSGVRSYGEMVELLLAWRAHRIGKKREALPGAAEDR